MPAATGLGHREPRHAATRVEARRLGDLVPAAARDALPIHQVAAATVAGAQPGLDKHDAPVHVPVLAAEPLLKLCSDWQALKEVGGRSRFSVAAASPSRVGAANPRG